jgi:hypothetical protein
MAGMQRPFAKPVSVSIFHFTDGEEIILPIDCIPDVSDNGCIQIDCKVEALHSLGASC